MQFEVQTSGGSTVQRHTVNGTSATTERSSERGELPVARGPCSAARSGPWSDFATFRTIAVPGCINGLLLDPAA